MATAKTWTPRQAAANVTPTSGRVLKAAASTTVKDVERSDTAGAVSNGVDDVDVAEALSMPPESVPTSAALSDQPPFTLRDEASLLTDPSTTDWSKSYYGLSTQAFSKEIADILLAPIDSDDVEMKPGQYI